MRILIVEDDERLARLLARAIEEEHHRVDVALDGDDGLARALDVPYDAVVLDVMLPERDGLAVCRALRAQGQATPILMLTARDSISDRVRGLDAGADDYLVKPFALSELLARLRAVVRRHSDPSASALLRVDDLVLDRGRRDVRRGDRVIALTAREFALVEFLMRHAGQALSRDQILRYVWGYDADPASNVVDTYVHYLRDKIDRGEPKKLLRTVRGVGYALGG